MLSLLAIVALAHARPLPNGCAQGWDPSALTPILEQAEARLFGSDLQGAIDAMAVVDQALPCLTAVAPPPWLAVLYRVEAEVAWARSQAVPGGTEVLLPARAAFAACRRLDASCSVARVMGNGATARAITDFQPLPVTVPFLPPSGCGGWVDGVAATTLPATVPTLLQLTDGTGEVRFTRLLPPGASPPAFPADLCPPPVAPGIPDPDPRPSPALLGSAAASGIGALGLYLWALNMRFRYDADPEGQVGLVKRNHVVNGAAAGLGAVSLGLGVATVATWRF